MMITEINISHMIIQDHKDKPGTSFFLMEYFYLSLTQRILGIFQLKSALSYKQSEHVNSKITAGSRKICCRISLMLKQSIRVQASLSYLTANSKNCLISLLYIARYFMHKYVKVIWCHY